MINTTLTQQRKLEIANLLVDTNESPFNVAVKYGLDVLTGAYEVMWAANEYGVWRCDACHYWVDECYTIKENDKIICKGCKKK